MTNTFNNVPRELLEVIEQTWRIHYQGGPVTNDIAADAIEKGLGQLRALLSAPSPAGVDGLEVVAWSEFDGEGGHELRLYENNETFLTDWLARNGDKYADWVEPLCRLSDAQAIIDGLRGEVAALRKRAKTAEREAGSALRTYKGLERVARVVSDNSDQVCGELNVLRQKFDQQAKRIGEMEGLLDRVKVSLSLDDTEWGYSAPEKYKLLADIRAALSAGKEGE